MAPAQPDLLARRRRHFVLWRPAVTDPPPRLHIGQLELGNPPRLLGESTFDLHAMPDAPDLWSRPAQDCGLDDGHVYHYWFEVTDSRPGGPGSRMLRTDPLATTVDWRLLSPRLAAPYGDDDRWPAAVVLWRDGELRVCDPDGAEPDWRHDAPIAGLPANNETVFYKLPTRWARSSAEGGLEVASGTFADILALVDPATASVSFRGLAALDAGRSYLTELGVTTLELSPIADSWVVREWGYATSNYFAPDHDLGFPRGYSHPRPNADLAGLVVACHQAGVRVGYDAVMGFGQRDPYREIAFLDFHVQLDSGDPEQDDRSSWGGDLFKYDYWTDGYDPVTGARSRIAPGRQLMKAHIAHWLLAHRIDSVRIDSVNTVYSWDFVQELTQYAREMHRTRAVTQGLSVTEADRRFLVVGEELGVPLDLVRQGRVDALGNEIFKRRVRHAILGDRDPDTRSFEETVRQLVDCRLLGFADGAQAVNYVTSHDVEGFRNERLYDFLNNNGVVRTEERIKLAFVCLLTAVGIPMVLAGEEFGDQHDLPVVHPEKQVDPVNFSRMQDPWRRRVIDHVQRLIALRRRAPALSVNDTEFLHVDLTDGRRVIAWRRGGPDDDPVVVVANFSDWGTPEPTRAEAEYLVRSWPSTPPGRQWYEVTQDRRVPREWVGREPLYPWEAKVYALLPP